jgi:hypothetical protein
MLSATPLLALLGLAAEAAPAATAPEAGVSTASLEVRAVGDCGSRADLLTRVARRSPRIRFSDQDATVAIRVAFATGPAGGVVAEMVMAEPGEKPRPRRLAARSCDEAADGVALIIAVTLDPSSATAPSPAPARAAAAGRAPGHASGGVAARPPGSPSGDGGTESSPPSGPPATPPTPLADEPVAKPAAPEQTADVVAVPPTPSPPAGIETRRRWGGDLAVQMVSGPAPAVMPGIAVTGLAALDRSSLWSPAVIVGALHVGRSNLAEPGGKASFTLDAAVLDLCALRLRVGTVEARGCGSLLAGLLSASGSDTFAGAAATRPFGAAGLSTVVGTYLGDNFELSARLSVGRSWPRDSFEFSPTQFYRTAAYTVSGSVGAGIRLP